MKGGEGIVFTQRSCYARLAIASLVVGVFAVLSATPVHAQYMYLDSNGNGVHDVGDRLRTCPTTVDIWLNTTQNRNGTAATCAFGTGDLDLGHYEFVLQAVGGTVTYGAMTNQVSGFGGSLARDIRDTNGPVYYHNGSFGSTVAGGLIKLATMTIKIDTGSPRIDIISKHPANGTGRTSFGSQCPADAFYDHTNRHGATWSDVDGLAQALTLDHPPVAGAPGISVPTDGSAVTFTVSATDIDSDPIQTFTADLSLLPLVNDATFTASNLNTLTATGSFSWTPTVLDVGDYVVTFTAGNCLASLAQAAIIHVIGVLTGAEGAESRPVYFMAANQPNPFAPSTSIDYSLAKEGDVRIHVYSANGRSVRALLHASMPQGPHRISWDGMDDAGKPVASGVYWCRLESGSFRMSRRMILLR